MMRHLLLLASALGVLTPAAANVYRLANASLSARVEHPFAVVVLATEQIQGSLEIDPADLRHAPGLEVKVATASLCPGTRLGDYVASQLQPEVQPAIEFHSRYAETLSYPPEKPVTSFEAVFRGAMQIAGSFVDSRVSLKCRIDGPALHCTFGSRFPISKFGLTVPHLLWVKAKDEVKVEGEAYFAPPEATP